jgi:3-phosphoshikimate 1-carboxyvinyltransferase
MTLNKNSILKGIYFPPGDKSISHRILILAGQAIGNSKIYNLLQSEDVINTLKAMRLLGITIKRKGGRYEVYGVPPGGLFKPNKIIDFGNSGTGIRLISGLISSNNIEATLVGDKSLSKRPMKRVTDHLVRIGAEFKLRNKLFPPIKLKGTGNAIPLKFEVIIPSAQIKSSIMLSALNTNGTVKIKEFKSTRDHTENMLKSMGYNIKVKENSMHRFIEMRNDKELKTINYNVPGDPSSAAFFISAACLRPGSKLIVKNMLFNKTRVGFIKTLKNMGGNIKIVNKKKVHNEIIADLRIEQRKYLNSTVLDSNDVPLQIDEIPILSIAASFANGLTIFKGLKELTVKESNRLLLIHENLKKIGVKSIIKNYDLHIYGNHELKKGAAIIKHHEDHRILMSFFISNMICKKSNIIKDKSCIKTSYPTFFKHISQFSN